MSSNVRFLQSDKPAEIFLKQIEDIFDLYCDSAGMEGFSVTKETTLRCMVSIGIVLVITGGIFSAFVSIPRMAVHPEVIKDGAVDSAWFISVIIPLVVAAFLLIFFILNRHNLARIKAYLIVVEVAVILLSLMIAKQANYYSEYDFALLELIYAGIYLIAGILLIIVSVKIKRSASSETK